MHLICQLGIYVPNVRKFSLGKTKIEIIVFCISAKEEIDSINKTEGRFTQVPILQPSLKRLSLSQGVCP